MGTLATVVRERKQQLRSLLIASQRLDAAQEKLEREVKRIINRKRSVPEVADAERLATMAGEVEGSLGAMSAVIQGVANTWGSM